MSQNLVRKFFSRRQLLQSTGPSLGALYAVSQITGIPIPILAKIPEALAQGTVIAPVNSKLFIVITNEDGIRPNDFNMQLAAQPEFKSLNWNPATQAVAVTHADGDVKMFPPGIGNLAKYGNRMAAIVGVDTGNNSHPGGNTNASTNAMAGVPATSIHTIVGNASGTIVPSIAFTGTTARSAGAQSGGVTPAGLLNTIAKPSTFSTAVASRMTQFRNAFHSEVVAELSDSNKQVIDQYWKSDASFRESQKQSAALFTQPAPPNTFLGQMQMALRVFNAGISNAFMIDGTGGQGFGFDTHGGNGPQLTLSKTMSDTIAQFLDEAAAANSLDKVNIIITTAFGRNPTFNGGGGDDHLPANGHMTLIGPDFRPGSFGKTSNTQATARGVVGWAVDPATGAVASQPSPGGEFQQLNAAMVLKGVAEAVGVPKATADTAFPNIASMPFIKKPR
jgi:hypothetical protein